METQLEIASADWASIYHELGAKATKFHWHRTTLDGTHCYCPLAALLMHAGALLPASNENDIADMAEMTWPHNFRFGFLDGFDQRDRTKSAHALDPDYRAGWRAAQDARHDLLAAGLLDE